MKFLELLEAMRTMDLQTNETATGRITIKQSERNKLRKDLMDAFCEFLAEKDVNAFMTNDGIIINVENETIGEINMEVKLTLKSLDYDLDEELEKFEATKSAKKSKKE